MKAKYSVPVYVGGVQTMAQTPNLACYLLANNFVNKFHQNTALSICICIVYAFLQVVMAGSVVPCKV